MSNGAGVWLDHRRAVVINFTAEGRQTLHFQSGLRQLIKDVDGSRQRSLFGTKIKGARGPKPAPAEKADLGEYLEQVAQAVRNADSIVVAGPGQAKIELRKLLEKWKLADRIVGVEPAQRMSDRLLAKHFQNELFPETAPKKPTAITPRERKSLSNSKNPGNGVVAGSDRTRNEPPFEAAAAPGRTSRKRQTGSAAQILASESPEKRRAIRTGTGRANAYANMPKARKVR